MVDGLSAYRNAYQNTNRGQHPASSVYSPNAFISEINPTGNLVLYSTYLGGTGSPYYLGGTAGDVGSGIALDPTNNVYVTGQAFSTDFPFTSGAFQTSNGSKTPNNSGKAFISKLEPATGRLMYSTYLGGSAVDAATSIAVDSSGDAYVTVTPPRQTFPQKMPTRELSLLERRTLLPPS